MAKIYLGINSALQSFSEICLVREEGAKKSIIDFFAWKNERNESQMLLPSIVDLLKKNSLRIEDVSEVFTITGPGSFVSIRISAVIANAIVQNSENSAEVKLYTIDTFEYLSRVFAGAAKVLTFAGGKTYYVFDCKKKSYEIKELSDADFEDLDKKETVFDIKNSSYNNVLEFSSRNCLGNVILSLLENGEMNELEVKEKNVVPNYIKEASITI
jgi:tRNA A37 threonylcarbamoyladenosine modification protein TsaB